MKAGSYTLEEKEQIRSAVRKKYEEVSSSADKKFKYQTGRAGAEALGYDHTTIAGVEEQHIASFCGVGNPFSLGEIAGGSDVLDVGCGVGFDLVVAQEKSGPEGRICGVDLTEEMVLKARAYFQQKGVSNVEVFHVASEKLPFDGSSFDIVISNGVINLSPAKHELFAEIFRVLKPGGRLQVADIVLDKSIPEHMAGSLEAWAQ